MADKEYTVYFPVYSEYAITVTADPDSYADEEEMVDALIEAGYDNMPGDICAQCSGWGRGWHLEFSADGVESHYINDEEGKTIWGDPQKKLGW